MKKARSSSRQGFTLVEILVVIGILGILAVIGSQMFFSLLKSSAKTRVLAEVKQNGNYALSVMGRITRNAKSIETCALGMEKIRITNPNQEWIEFDLSGTRIASVSALRTDYLTSNKVTIDTGEPFQFDCVQSGNSPPVVTISFTLIQSAAGVRPEEEASIDFKTTVSLRTY